jgi:hypothetical protein
MILVDIGSVFWAMRRIRPSDKDHVEGDVGIFHPHRDFLLGREVEQHPLAVGEFLAVHQSGGLFFFGRCHLDRENMHAGLGDDLKRLDAGGLRFQTRERTEHSGRGYDPKPRPQASPHANLTNTPIQIHGHHFYLSYLGREDFA